MKRCLLLGALLAIGFLSLSVAGFQAPSGPTPKSLSATKIERVKDNLYVVTMNEQFANAKANLQAAYDELKK